MATTLTYSATTLTLPDDLLWADEFAWQAVEQRSQYGITGKLLLQASGKLAGQPVTLEGSATHAWITRGVLATLRTWANTPGAVMQLVLHDAAAVSVVFDHAAGPIEAAPIIDYAAPVDADDYSITLRFLKV